ncbi:MAG: AbgT family transporter [Butyrivibrio sp.]|nr:AbgT family transporter [Butyrivibrio sp.]
MVKERKQLKLLNLIERGCDKLPAPAILFLLLFLITAVLSAVLSMLHVSVYNPATEIETTINNFFSNEGLYWFLCNMVTNFTTFPPLGIVLVMSVAVGFCEQTGMIEMILNEKLKHIYPPLLPYAVVFIGIMGNLASDTACIVIPPLAGLLFLAAGRHPIGGMICGYAGVNAGFSANLFIAGTDGLVAAITQEAANDFFGENVVNVDITCNWYFMAASTFLCTIVIGLVYTKLVEPRLAPYDVLEKKKEEVKAYSPQERKALFFAGISMLVYLVVVIAATIWGPLGIVVGQEKIGTRTFVGSYLLKNLIPVLFFFFAIPGIVFGIGSGAVKGFQGIYQLMVKNMEKMGGFLVFCFFCAQFQKLFTWTHIDSLISVNGANALKATGFTGINLIVVFILFSSFINIFITSASAKWSIFAPVFVPMMYMAGGFSPAMTQLFYRIGDSATNCFTPIMPYLWISLKDAQDKYDPNVKVGTFVSNLFLIGMILLVAWILFLIGWLMLGLPIGPA